MVAASLRAKEAMSSLLGSPLYGTTWGFSSVFSSCNFLCYACTLISLHSVFCCSLLVGLPDGKCGNVGWSCTDLLPIQTKVAVLVKY